MTCCQCEIREANTCMSCNRSFLSIPSASIQKMVPRQAAVPWIRRRVLGWCCTLLSPRASAGSPSCTARTPTTTRPPKPCHATPPSTVRGKHAAVVLDPSRGALNLNMFFQICRVHLLTHTHRSNDTLSQSNSDGCDCNYAFIMLMKSWWILLALTVVLCFLACLSASLSRPKSSISVFQDYVSV